MIFNEIYSAYYNTVAKVISQVLDGNVSEKVLNKVISENAFGESVLTILPSLKREKWQIIKSDMTTPIKHKPTMPLTTIQKQWLKAISLDPRIKLFGVDINGLDDVDPLFTCDDYYIFDKYSDGDPYDDEGYITRFRTILSALKSKQALKIQTLNRKGNINSMTVLPVRLEYSEKDDKFRLISKGCRYGNILNLARIIDCKVCDKGDYIPKPDSPPSKSTVTLRIFDQRNALERCMLHFAHFEKRAERIDKKHYLVHIKYNKIDEVEIVIRVLSFGPLVEVVDPLPFRNLIIERLEKQKSCGLF